MKQILSACFLSIGLLFTGQSLFAQSAKKPRRTNPNRPKTTTTKNKNKARPTSRKPAGRRPKAKKTGTANRKNNSPRVNTTAPSEAGAGGDGFSAYKIESKIILKEGGKILRGVIIVEGPRALELVTSKGKSINIPRKNIVKIIRVLKKENKEEAKGDKAKVIVSSYELNDYVLEKDEDGLLVITAEGERDKVTPKGSTWASGGAELKLPSSKDISNALKKLSPSDRKKLLDAAKKHLKDTSDRNPKGSIPDSLKGLLKW